MQITSYIEAEAAGLKRYFTGKPCKRGHRAERWVSNCRCLECAYTQTNEWGKRNTLTKYLIHQRFVEKNPTYKSEWFRAHPDAKRSASAKWYKANADKEIRRSVDWAKNNPEKSRANCRNRTARRKEALGSHTAEQIVEMLKRQKWKCAACGISIKERRHIDHIVPLVLGGSNDIGNLQGLCPTCNCSKGPKDPVEWALENGRLL